MRPRTTILRAEILEDRCTPATWGNPWPDASQLTLSFAPDGTQVGSHTSNLFATLNAIALTAAWEQEILRAFQTWAAQANINISVVADQGLPFGTTGPIQGDARFGDIRIAAYVMPASAVAIASPVDLAAGTWSGDVALNSAVSLGIDGSGQYDLFTVMLHEAGHVFGLADNTDPTSVEDSQYLGVRTSPSPADIAALQAINGTRPPAAGNNQLATATPLSLLANGTGSLGMTIGSDITSLQDRDVYSFSTLLNLGGVDITVRTADMSLLTPRATVYDAFGRSIVSTVETDPLQGGLVIHLSNVMPFSTYYVAVQSGQQNVFGIGTYELTVNDLPFLNNFLAGLTASVTQGLTAVTNGLINNDPLHTDASFATAAPMPQTFADGGGDCYDSDQASLSSASDVDYYKLQAPAGSSGDTLTAMVWGLENQVNFRVLLFDAQHDPLPADVVVNDGFSYVVQVPNVVPLAAYYVEVVEAANSPQTAGNYFVGADFTPHGEALQDLASDTLTASGPIALNRLTVNQGNQFFHFVLSASTAGSTANATVQMSLINATGQVVFAMTADNTEPISSDISLAPGSYTVCFAASSAGPLPALTYRLRGETLTDPEGPAPTDPTGDPGTAPTNGSGTPYDWNGGSAGGVPPQDPSSPPYSTTTPVVSLYNPGDQTNLAGAGVYIALSASDANNNPLAFSATGLPPGLTIDAKTGEIFGTIANNAAAAKPYVITVTASDTSANANAMQTFYWTVNPPVVNLWTPGDQTNLAGTNIYLALSASSSDGYALTYSATGLPAGLAIDPNTGVITGTIANDGASADPYVVSFTVTDPSSNVSAAVTLNWTVNPPVVNLWTPGDQTNLAGTGIYLALAASSSDGYALTYSATGLPAGLTLDPNTGVITGSIANDGAGADPYVVSITVTDPSSNVSAAVTVNWTVNPPMVNVWTPGDQTNLAGTGIYLALAASSSDGYALTYSATGLPAGLAIDPNTGVITGTIANDGASADPYVVIITVTDPSSNVSTTVTLNWTVNPPVVNLWTPGDQTNNTGTSVSLQVSASVSDGQALTFSSTGLPPGLTLDPNTGFISGTLTAGAGTYAVSVTVTDPTSGVSATVTFDWNIDG